VLLLYWLLLGVLVVWRITHLLHAEDGPWNLLAWARHALGRGGLAGVLDCFYCLSLWVALPAAWILGSDLEHRLLLWPALSAGAILIERVTYRHEVPPAPFVEGEIDDELLRTRTDDARRSR
jgi:hypothetical protein